MSSLINAIKERIDILDIAGQFLVLKRNQSRYRALCPFHSERSSSFIIYAASNSFHCFGCGAHGDVIDLYAHFHHVDIKTAVKQLQAEYGIAYEDSEEARKGREMNRFLDRKRDELVSLLEAWLYRLRDFVGTIATPSELDRYGDLYHEIARIEHWLHNLSVINDSKELKRLYDLIPPYLTEVYNAYWETEV